MRTRLLLTVSIFLGLATACSRDDAPTAPTAATPAAAPAEAPAAPAPQERVFLPEELDQMLAPIALYPDSLLAQVLMAATYPGDVADAVQWSKANPDAKGDSAIVTVQNQPWDPSVQSLVAFPQVVAMLGQDPAWVQRLGDAFLAQPEDVMDSVQRLRHKAQSAGTLASSEHLTVTSEPAPPPEPLPPPGDPGYVEGAEAYSEGSDTTIIIESPSEEVYVPAYDPTTVYGAWSYPSYPPVYYPPAYGWYPGQALWTGLAFGAGIAIADGLWGDCDWNGGDIDIDVDRYNNINVNDIDRTSNRFEHNAGNRDGVPYRDKGNRENNGNRLAGGENRAGFRGEDRGRTEARENARRSAEQRGAGDGRDRSRDQARQSMADRGMDTPARSSGEARDRAAAAGRDQPALADRAGAGGDRYGSGDRQGGRGGTYGDAAALGDRATATDRGGRGGSFSTVGSAESRAAGQRYQQQQATNRQSRDTARSSQQQRSSRSSEAFRGSSRPQQSRQSSDRGRQSSASSRGYSGGSRSSSGRQTSRSAPSRGGGGRSGGGRRG